LLYTLIFILRHLDHKQVDIIFEVQQRFGDMFALFIGEFHGDLKIAPMVAECPVNLECEVVKELSIEHRQMFIGKIVQSHISDKFLTEANGRKSISDLTSLDPILYALDNRYYSIGKAICVGYQEAEKRE